MHFLDNTFYAFLALLIFFAFLIYTGVHKKVHAALLDRGNRIAKDLGDAKRLREEAEALLKEYQQKRTDAVKEAQAIIDQAKREAESYAQESRQKLADMLERRSKQAEQKIAQAEATAIKEVRGLATDAAISAASQLIAEHVQGAKSASLIDEGIAGLKTQLN